MIKPIAQPCHGSMTWPHVESGSFFTHHTPLLQFSPRPLLLLSLHSTQSCPDPQSKCSLMPHCPSPPPDSPTFPFPSSSLPLKTSTTAAHLAEKLQASSKIRYPHSARTRLLLILDNGLRPMPPKAALLGGVLDVLENVKNAELALPQGGEGGVAEGQSPLLLAVLAAEIVELLQRIDRRERGIVLHVSSRNKTQGKLFLSSVSL